MNTHDIEFLITKLGNTITFKKLFDKEGDIEILAAIGKDRKMIILDEEIKPKTKRGRKLGSKNINKIVPDPLNRNSPDFLRNDTVLTKDYKEIDEELEDIEKSRKQILRKLDNEDFICEEEK